MNEQFVKTLAALEAAENEMANLGNTLDSLERVKQAQWHETQTVLDYCTRLNSMGNNIRVMLGKREKAMLEGVLAQNVLAGREAVEHSVQADEKPCPLDHKELFQTGVDVCPECNEVTASRR